MIKNQTGFGIVPIIIVLLVVTVIGGVGWKIANSPNSNPRPTETSTKTKTDAKQGPTPVAACTITEGWKKFENDKFKFSFYYPATEIAGTTTGAGGVTYGSGVSEGDEPHPPIIYFDPLVWSDGATLGNVQGSVDAVKQAMNSGGAKSIAALSRKVNLADNPNIPNDSVGELESFGTCSGQAWGFTVTGDYGIGFVSDSEGGSSVGQETTIAYISNDTSVYRVIFPTNNTDAPRILSSFKLL